MSSGTKPRGFMGYLLLGLGFLFCPCHLPITLPLVGLWLGGTAGANFLTENLALLIGLSTVLFLGALAAGWLLLSRERACGLDHDMRRD
jgi:cytochrome c biogenesis protein CcdA